MENKEIETDAEMPIVANINFSPQEEIVFKKLLKNRTRNKPCPCGSGIKFKKCCMGKFKKLTR